MLMAGIAASLAHNALDELGERDGDYELIRIMPCGRDRLLFAVSKVADMIGELNETYQTNRGELANV
jgi:hypothetical protein